MTLPAMMKVLQLKPGLEFGEAVIPVPTPKPDEIMIRTHAATICTSDFADIDHNPFGIALPRVLGHEGAGVVAAVGSAVGGFAVGDRVATHPVISCGKCASCRRGIGHLCENMGHLGYDRDGAYAEYYCIPAARARLVPDGLGLDVACLLEPVAVCLEAMRRGRVSKADNVLVAGDGPFGLIIARLCLREAAAKVILMGRREARLNQVPEASRLNVKETENVQETIRELTAGEGVDVAILAVASEVALNDCLQTLRRRGRLVVFSNLSHATPVDLTTLHVKELDLLGACNDENYIDEALALLTDPALHMDKMVTHHVPFPEWREALSLPHKRRTRR